MQRLHDIKQAATSFEQATSTGTADIHTIKPPAGAVACQITIETTDARVSFNGTDPAANNGEIFPKAQPPVYLPFAVAIRFASTAGASSIANVTWLF